MRHVKNSLIYTIVILLLPAISIAGTREDIETLQKGQHGILQRLEHVETLLQNQGLLDLMQQLQSLQKELRELRGDVEQHGHDLEGLRKRQRDLYLDIDRRLNDLQVQLGDRPAGSDKAAALSAPAEGAQETVDQERIEYMAAFEILRESRYPEAIDALNTFLQQYPNGKYANNAQYWLGEAYYASRNLEQAMAEFQKAIQLYPWSPKLPDAKLKLGYTYYELGQWAKARDELTGVMTTYPNSSFALLAEKRLLRMTQEGH